MCGIAVNESLMKLRNAKEIAPFRLTTASKRRGDRVREIAVWEENLNSVIPRGAPRDFR